MYDHNFSVVLKDEQKSHLVSIASVKFWLKIMLQEYVSGAFGAGVCFEAWIILSTILSQICSRHIWMHNALGACSKLYASGAVYNAPEAYVLYAPGVLCIQICSWSILD